MGTTLAALVILASTMTGQPCAGIDNGPNRAAAKAPGSVVWTSGYRDVGDDHLKYTAKRRPHPDTWQVIQDAEWSLQIGERGRKLRIACG